MNVLRLDSVVFETPDVARARRFYVDTLGLHVGTYIKDGATVADEDEKYFNLDLGGSLLGFVIVAYSILEGKTARRGTRIAEPNRHPSLRRIAAEVVMCTKRGAVPTTSLTGGRAASLR